MCVLKHFLKTFRSRSLTVLVPGEVGLGLVAGPGLARLVDGHDAELVPLALAQPRHPRLQLVDGRHAVVVVRDEGVEPAAELVLLLDDEVGDGPPAVVSGLVPAQRHALVVEVHDARLPRLGGRL